MTEARPFRFGVQARSTPSGAAWRAQAKRFEELGYSTLYVPDHFGHEMGPIAALMSAADATSKMRIGSLVFDNDYRHPVVLAKEAATLDLLSDGRFDLGLGAGWMRSDYDRSGIPFDPAPIRIERMEEALHIIKGLLAGGPVTSLGKHYQVTGHEGFPSPVQKPHPPIVLGGGGRVMLGLAAREADIVNVNFDLREGRVSPALVQTGVASATDTKIRWIKEAAGERFAGLELSVTVFLATVTDDRMELASGLAAGLGLEAADVLAMPHFLVGTIDEMARDLEERRARYGVSYVIFPGEAGDALGPLVQRLSGR